MSEEVQFLRVAAGIGIVEKRPLSAKEDAMVEHFYARDLAFRDGRPGGEVRLTPLGIRVAAELVQKEQTGLVRIRQVRLETLIGDR